MKNRRAGLIAIAGAVLIASLATGIASAPSLPLVERLLENGSLAGMERTRPATLLRTASAYVAAEGIRPSARRKEIARLRKLGFVAAARVTFAATRERRSGLNIVEQFAAAGSATDELAHQSTAGGPWKYYKVPGIPHARGFESIGGHGERNVAFTDGRFYFLVGVRWSGGSRNSLSRRRVASVARALYHRATATSGNSPTNTVLPVVSGSFVQGQTLTVSDGTWAGSPTGYTYKWQRCATGICSAISGATGSSYVLGAGDVGDTVEAVVTATNAGGSTAATSAQSATVTSSSDCFASPGLCGFPDPAFAWDSAAAWASGGGGVGPNNGLVATPCSSLPASGSITTSEDGQTIEDLDISGTITVQNANVTIDDVCVTTDGDAQLGSSAIKVLDAGATVEDSTVAGANDSSESVEQAITNFSSGAVTVEHVYAYDCGECLNTGAWDVSDSYILDNGMYDTDDHLEAVYVDGGGSEQVTINHSTLLSPPGWDGPSEPQGGQSSVLFGDTNGGRGGACSTQWDVTDNLLAGNGVLIYECGNASSVGSASLTFTGNRVASCIGPTYLDSAGYSECSDIPVQNGSDTNRNGDGYGYFPDGGLKGTDIDTYCTAGSTTWSDNTMENTGAILGC